MTNHEVLIIICRIAQEALTNVARHAQATEVRIMPKEIELGACMRIVDDGVGFDPQPLAPESERQLWGLLTMNERAQFIDHALNCKICDGDDIRMVT